MDLSTMASHSPSHSDCPSIQKMKSSKNDVHHMNAINNNVLRMSPRRQACFFAEWFRKLIDNDRGNLCLYLSDDAVLQWFGRTIKTKKKISGFLKYDMHCTSHRFTAVEVCGHFPVRGEKDEPVEKQAAEEEDRFEVLATPLHGDTPTGMLNNCLSRVSLRSLSTKRNRAPSSSPESPLASKKSKITQSPVQERINIDKNCQSRNKTKPRSLFGTCDTKTVNGNKTDNSITILQEGQGDCVPSTSGTGKKTVRVKEKNDDLFSQLPHSYVEVRCIIEFIKTRNKRGADIMKWERQCKLQVAYTEDPVYAGEYIIWTIVYSDNNKCRRNLLSAFEAVSAEYEKNKKS